MQFTTFTALLALASSAMALQVTAPTMGEMVDFSKDYTVMWASVSSDPGTFKISVVNQAGGGTPFTQTIAPSVNTPDGKYLIKGGTVTAPAGRAFQVNLESNSGMTTGILAQSNQFNITAPAPSSSSSSSSSSSMSDSSSSASASTTVKPTTTVITSTGSSTTVTSTSTGSVTSVSTSKGSGVATATPGAGVRNVANSLGLAAFILGGALLV